MQEVLMNFLEGPLMEILRILFEDLIVPLVTFLLIYAIRGAKAWLALKLDELSKRQPAWERNLSWIVRKAVMYVEQVGEQFDWDSHEKFRRAKVAINEFLKPLGVSLADIPTARITMEIEAAVKELFPE